MKEIRLQLNHKFSNVELQQWPNLFDSPALKVTPVADGNYYLTACRVEKLKDPTEVFKSENNGACHCHIELKIDFERLAPGDEEHVRSSYTVIESA